MSLGVGVFASVVLILAVYHKGFRKVLLWAVAITVILALLGAGSYLGYDQYAIWQQTKAHKQAVKDCVARFPKADTFDELACDENPAAVPVRLGAPVAPSYTVTPPAKQNGAASATIPSGHLELPGHTSVKLLAPEQSKASLERSEETPANVTETLPTITATVTCDVVVFDRDKYGEGDQQAIDSLHKGDTVQYVGHVTVGNQDIIRIHGRKGYVSGCVQVSP